MDLNDVKKRRLHIEQAIADLEAKLADYKVELSDLDATERVFARLSGSGASVPRPQNPEANSTPSRSKPDGIPTYREMIREALQAAADKGVHGLEPKEIKQYVRWKYWPGMKGDQINSNAWRMHNETKELGKIGSKYVLAKEKPADNETLAGSSAGLFSNPVQGREAGPGGGT